MSIQVNDFQWEPGKNDAEYIKLLESSRDEWKKIAQKAIAKLKTQCGVPVTFDFDGDMVCGNCGCHLDKKYGECPKCGRKVAWK